MEIGVFGIVARSTRVTLEFQCETNLLLTLEAAQLIRDTLQLPMSAEELVEVSQAKLKEVFPTATLMPGDSCSVQGLLFLRCWGFFSLGRL